MEEYTIDETVYTVGELKKILHVLPNDMPLEIGAAWNDRNGRFQYAHRKAKCKKGIGLYVEFTDINGHIALRLSNAEVDDMEAEL